MKRLIKTKTLDSLFRDVCYKKLGRKCEYCGAENGQIHHIYSRKNFGVRFSTVNVAILCPLHHTFSSEFSAHQTPLLFAEFLTEHRPKGFIGKLKREAMRVVRAYEIDRESLKQTLNKELI
jgi:hypothetical protein